MFRTPMGSPLTGRLIQVWWVEIGDFRPISHYISKRARSGHKYHGRLIGTIVCTLSNGAISSELILYSPQNAMTIVPRLHNSSYRHQPKGKIEKKKQKTLKHAAYSTSV